MPYINLNDVNETDRKIPPSVLYDGVSFAHNAVQFASLALTACQNKWSFPRDHLYALAIELALKSLALRSGASLKECRSAGHDPTKMMKLIERHGTHIPDRLKTRLSDKQWFQAFLFMSRYPALSELNTSIETTIFRHPDYPEMIAEILETHCRWPLSFERGSALAEIESPPSGMVMMRFTEIGGDETGWLAEQSPAIDSLKAAPQE